MSCVSKRFFAGRNSSRRKPSGLLGAGGLTCSQTRCKGSSRAGPPTRKGRRGGPRSETPGLTLPTGLGRRTSGAPPMWRDRRRNCAPTADVGSGGSDRRIRRRPTERTGDGGRRGRAGERGGRRERRRDRQGPGWGAPGRRRRCWARRRPPNTRGRRPRRVSPDGASGGRGPFVARGSLGLRPSAGSRGGSRQALAPIAGGWVRRGAKECRQEPSGGSRKGHFAEGTVSK